MLQPFLLFMFDSPMQIIAVVAVGFLLFGSTKLPQLAKSIGQTRKAFKDGMREADEEEQAELLQKRQIAANPVAPEVNSVSDEELMAELRRRAEVKQI